MNKVYESMRLKFTEIVYYILNFRSKEFLKKLTSF